jgi:Putative adhesin
MRGMMRTIACAGVLLALVACAGGDRVREQIHRTLSVSNTPKVSVQNVAGAVRVDTWQKPLVDVVATKYGNDIDDLRNITIDVHQEGDAVTVATRYSGGTHQGGVGYQISVPAGASVHVQNVAGAVDLAGVGGNVVVGTQAGRITAALGKVEGNRSITLSATTGAIELSIARDSSASVEVSSTVGHFSSTFPEISQSSENIVGMRAAGNLGSGSAKIRLSTTVGAIELRE